MVMVGKKPTVLHLGQTAAVVAAKSLSVPAAVPDWSLQVTAAPVLM